MSTEADALITDDLRSWIGRSSGPFALPEEVSASDVRRYADATGDRNPLWLDDGFARAHGHPGRLVPPVLVVELGWRVSDGAADPGRPWHADLPLPPSYTDARNAGLEIEWLRPVCVGERLAINYRIVDIRARQGRAGLGVYVTRVAEYAAGPGDVVARVEQTIVRLPRAEPAEPSAPAGR